MLRKKLIAFGLVGIITFGATVSNTAIAIAAPTTAEASDNMMHEIVRCGMEQLERFINEGKHESAISWQKQLKNHLKVLRNLGEDTKDLQKKFDKLSKQINLLKEKNKKIEPLEKNITNTIEIILALLNSKIYNNIPNQFETLTKDMNKLSKLKPIDKTILDKVENLKYKYNNRQKFDEIDNLILLIGPQLDNLSNAIKEKNTYEAILLKREVYSDIKKLGKLSKVPQYINDKFYKYCEELYKLLFHGEDSTRL